MLRVRPICAADEQAFFKLAELSGPGFTSLPNDETLLRSRITFSEKSFALALEKELGEQGYLLVIEDMDSGSIVGTSAVKTGVGLSKPFFSYKLFSITQVSKATERKFDMDVMILVNEYAGATEVGTLFVHPKYRGGGTGSLIARSRYLLIATKPERFGRNILSELRGVVHADGSSPFFEHLAKTFFQMSFEEADYLSGTTDKQFILDLMPKYPIYVDLLAPEAQAVIGKTHKDGMGARRLLEFEGFRYERVVDIFDGGPTMSAPRDDLRTVKTSQTYIAQSGEPGPVRALVSNEKINGFRACAAMVNPQPDEGKITVAAEVLDALEIAPGDPIRFVEN
ncbi:Arginine N-succinyltransferase [hydrothermal vent metagenome]|uniref:Arginine N-succinyltransferase n=1 Tax=hydrothermal vent metagenome TaxID=652676 RepID=A0A3B0S8J6_9ZZZZ